MVEVLQIILHIIPSLHDQQKHKRINLPFYVSFIFIGSAMFYPAA